MQSASHPSVAMQVCQQPPSSPGLILLDEVHREARFPSKRLPPARITVNKSGLLASVLIRDLWR